MATAILTLSEQLHSAVQQLAGRRRQTPEQLLLLAIEEFIQRQQRRDQFDQDAVTSWEDFEHTRLHVTQQEVEAWLKKRAAGEIVDPPECHL